MHQPHFTRWLQVIVLLTLLILPFANVGPVAHAQDTASSQVYTWRELAILVHYPATWTQTSYTNLPMFVTDAAGVEAVAQGQAPNVPAVGLLYYPQAHDLNADEFIATMFPEQTVQPTLVQGEDAFAVEYVDEATGQAVYAISFESPVTRVPGIILGVAPDGDWASFAPEFNDVLANLEFLGTDADFDFAEGEAELRAPSNWAVADNGQVLAVASELTVAEAVVRGELDDLTGFVRAQIVVPSGLGLDIEAETIAQDVLERFVGTELENPVNFMWAEEMPAVAAEFQFGDLTFLMVAIVSGDNALLVGGAATAENWTTYRAWTQGALNMTIFNEQPAPANLDAILNGDADMGDGVFGMVLE